MTTPSSTDPILTSAASAAPLAEEQRRSRWPWPVQCLVAVLVLAVALAAVAALSLIPAVRGLDRPDVPLVPAVAGGFALLSFPLVVAVLVVALAARLDGGRRLRDLGWCWNRRSLPALAIGLLVSAVIIVGIGVPLQAAGLLRPEDAGIDGEPVWAVLVVGVARALALQAIPEELIFRGYLMTSLRVRPVPAVLISGLVFGAIHLTSSGGQEGWGERILYLAMPTGFGLAAGALMLTTRSLWAAVGIHGGLHLTVLILALLPRTGLALTVGDGPALWLSTGLAWTLVAVALMARLRRRGGWSRVGGDSAALRAAALNAAR